MCLKQCTETSNFFSQFTYEFNILILAERTKKEKKRKHVYDSHQEHILDLHQEHILDLHREHILDSHKEHIQDSHKEKTIAQCHFVCQDTLPGHSWIKLCVTIQVDWSSGPQNRLSGEIFIHFRFRQRAHSRFTPKYCLA